MALTGVTVHRKSENEMTKQLLQSNRKKIAI